MTTCTLIVLDGIGLRSQQEANAVAAANTPTLDYLFEITLTVRLRRPVWL
jgi:2,3-bisphosphoglycerate-independent phosphoglycerate mutase